MNKSELVAAMAEKANISKKATEESLNAMIDVVKEAMAKGDKVQLVGFGTFQTKTRAARKGKNPQTGAEIKIPACKTPAFKTGKALKELVNKK